MAKATASQKPERITGADLVAFNNQSVANGVPQREIAIQAGYYTESDEKGIRVSISAFQRALLAASGVAMSARTRAGLAPVIHVSNHGQLVIGPRYTRGALEKGQPYQVDFDTETLVFTLTPIVEDEQAEVIEDEALVAA